MTEKLLLHKNDFESEVNMTICKGLKRIKIFQADCLPDLDGSTAKVQCTCCTDCCDSKGRCFKKI